MTKKQITETIQQLEAAAWREMHERNRICGRDHVLALTARTRWTTIHEMMSGLQITPDSTLPDNQAVFRMLHQS
jgi:hypothetical protein